MSDVLTEIQGLDASDTWQSLYVAMTLTFLQITVFLVCFEVARRHLPGVYDRRRL